MNILLRQHVTVTLVWKQKLPVRLKSSDAGRLLVHSYFNDTNNANTCIFTWYRHDNRNN